MDTAAEFDLLRQLIADSKNREAAERLSHWFEGKSTARQDAALALLNRVNTLQEDINRGVIGQEAAQLENNRITQALLDLARQLEQTGPLKSVKSTKPGLPRWIIGAGIVLLAILTFIIFYKKKDHVPASFDLTVHLHGPGGESDLIRGGKVKILLGDYHLPAQDIGADGKAVFEKIPGEYFTQQVSLAPLEMRYKVMGQTAQTPQESQSISFELQPLPDTTVVRGIVFLPGKESQPAAGAQLDFNLGKAQGVADNQGHFEVPVPEAGGATVKLMITYNGKQRYNRDVTISKDIPLQITLNP